MVLVIFMLVIYHAWFFTESYLIYPVLQPFDVISRCVQIFILFWFSVHSVPYNRLPKSQRVATYFIPVPGYFKLQRVSQSTWLFCKLGFTTLYFLVTRNGSQLFTMKCVTTKLINGLSTVPHTLTCIWQKLEKIIFLHNSFGHSLTSILI